MRVGGDGEKRRKNESWEEGGEKEMKKGSERWRRGKWADYQEGKIIIMEKGEFLKNFHIFVSL